MRARVCASCCRLSAESRRHERRNITERRGTGDSDQLMSQRRRFGSVTVLNGHIHQIVQKVEGNVTFHTARSTAYPQPLAGVGSGPGPLKVPPDRWVNMDDEPHTVASDTGLFRSSGLDTNESFSYKFDKPGTYHIACSIHPRMVATIVVE